MLSVLSILLCICVSVLFGFKKQGYYIDEYYLYSLANGTQLGIDIQPGQWNDTARYYGQFVSEGTENYHYRQIYDNLANFGVHPPLYYVILHFVSSVFTGVFSKWIGISINIFLLIPVLILVRGIAWRLSGENEVIALLTVALYGISPATISMVVLVRMYLLLSLWTILYAYIHVEDLKRQKLSVKQFLIPVFLCGFFGFLTQYFYVVIMFFITFVYAFYLLVFCHRVKDAIMYGLTALSSLVCTYFVWPVSYFHIFKGYRGQGAVTQLQDVAQLVNRLRTHIGYLNKTVFGGLIPVFIILLIYGIILLIKRCIQIKKDGKTVMGTLTEPTKGFIMLLIAVSLNYLVLTQIGLMDGITCIRQYYTAYALFLVLLPVGIYRLFEIKRISTGISVIITAIMICAVLVSGHIQKSVIYLYEDNKVATDYAKAHPETKVLMVHKDDGMYDSVIQEVLLYPRIFFVTDEEIEKINDTELSSADELLVYMTSGTDDEKCFEYIHKLNPSLKNRDHVWDSGSFSCYLMHN